MSNIGDWLEQHGLGKYTDLFVENEIDLDVLDQITLEELQSLGIPWYPPRRTEECAVGFNHCL